MKRILCVAVLLAALATSSQAQRKTQIVESAKPTQVPEGKNTVCQGCLLRQGERPYG